MRGRIVTIGAAAAFVVSASLAGCGVFGGKHEVGECVRTEVGAGGTDIETVDCPASGTSVIDHIGDPIYQIAQVLDYDASCPNDDQWGIELQHEPDDAVYCLVPV
jgi:hypothetical protein